MAFSYTGQRWRSGYALYSQYWRPVEVDFGQEGYATHFDSFMRHYLTVKTGEIPKVRAVYDAFKQHARSPAVADAGVENLVADIRGFAGNYCAMALGREADPALDGAFHDLRELKVDVAYPFLLELYRDYDEDLLTKGEFLQAVRCVESYVFRRAISAIPTNSMNKTFAGLTRTLKKDRYLESIQAAFLLLPSYRRFPDDVEFERDLQLRDLYNFRSRSYWLRRMENHDRKERVPVDDYTIEHILPQNENLSAHWKADLGPEWQRIQQTWLHTLGNLTLTGYNSELSDRPFPEKRDMKGGFGERPLRMNRGLDRLDHWDEEEIKHRAGRPHTVRLRARHRTALRRTQPPPHPPDRGDPPRHPSPAQRDWYRPRPGGSHQIPDRPRRHRPAGRAPIDKLESHNVAQTGTSR